MVKVQTVAVIGAGVGGLTSIKACLEEDLVPVCFECFDSLGGLWNLTPHHTKGQGAAVYNDLRLNTSKHMSCFSDFPFPDDSEEYVDVHTMRRYLQEYADHFDLMSYIRFNCEVKDVRPALSYDKTGRWSVTYTKQNGTHTTEQFDAVIVCSGKDSIPHYPTYAGSEQFCGETMHAISYRNPSVFKDKVVLVIGNGQSAVDISTFATRCAKQVYLSVGKGMWIFPRIRDPLKRPIDHVSRLMTYMPKVILNAYLMKSFNTKIDHYGSGLATRENRGPMYSSIIIHEEIIDKIWTGEILVKNHIDSFTKSGVVFKDGTEIDGVDVIVYATGYHISHTFLSTDILPPTLDKLNLYRMILPVSLKHPTLCVVGSVRILVSGMCLRETQARWVVALWTNNITLPSRETMLKDIEQNKQRIFDRYGHLKIRTVDLKYHDEISDELALFPKFWPMFFTQPIEFIKFYLLPAFPVTYRLYGRHAWPGARRALVKAIGNYV